MVGFAETPFVLCVAPEFADQLDCRTDRLPQIEERQGDLRKRDDQRPRLHRNLSAKGRGHRDLCGYKATANAIQDVNGQQIDFAFADVVFAIGQAKQGRIKILAIASDDALPGASRTCRP